MSCKWKWIGIWSFLVISVDVSLQASSPSSNNYVAAVVEYPPSYIKDDPVATLRENTGAYVQHIKAASAKGADIIIFPECGLTSVSSPGLSPLESWTTLIPAASENYVPCTGNLDGVSEALKNLSCSAKENSIYVAVNIAEKYSTCTEEEKGEYCYTDKNVYYNSMVVFDRTGKIICRYRKQHLFGEPGYSVTPELEVETFDTDYGVRYGIFICFDIMFQSPALNLTRHLEITDIIFSVAWFSEKPFLTAIQAHAGWAYSENVNLLAAGYNRPGGGSTGTGVYLGSKGASDYTFACDVRDEMLIVRVPKIQRSNADSSEESSEEGKKEHVSAERIVFDIGGRTIEPKRHNGLFLLSDNLTNYNTVPFHDSITQELCHGNFCCHFAITAKTVDPTTKYRIAVFDGDRYYGLKDKGGISICGLIQCSDDSIESCGSVRYSETTFESILITGKFGSNNTLTMPITLTTRANDNCPSLLPWDDFDYRTHSHDDHVHASMSLRKETKNIISFAMYSRVYVRDKTASGRP